MIWENFKGKFHESWHPKIKPFIESQECDEIYSFLKSEGGRKKIAPLSVNTFRCFLETPYDQIKVIMVGMCPYHTFRDDMPVADGLLMGCSVTNYVQPSLEKFYRGIEIDLHQGLKVNHSANPDVSYLAKQGVLMLNAGLTVEANKPGSHNFIWEPFMKYLFQEVFDVIRVPVIFLGKEAANIKKYIDPFTWVFEVSHPASAAYSGTEWDPEGTFRNVNNQCTKITSVIFDGTPLTCDHRIYHLIETP